MCSAGLERARGHGANVDTDEPVGTRVDQAVVCPVCGNDTFTTRMEQLEIAYFEEILQLTYSCEGCGFRRTDLHITQEDDPKRFRLEVEAVEDLSARVVRSASAHFEIPELDIRAEPGEAADSFVTNAEGLLDRCINALETALRGAESDQKRERAERLLARADRMREVEEAWTILIEDPLGNSAILGDNVEETELTEAEAEELGVPYPVVDLDDADPVEP